MNNRYTSGKCRDGTPSVFLPNGARHSYHDTLEKAEKAAEALNRGGEKEYQKAEWDN